MKPLRPALALLVLGSLVPSGGADAAPGGNPLRPFVAKNKLYALWIPAQWTVHDEAGDDSFRVLAESPDRASAVEFYWQRRDQGRANMLQMLGVTATGDYYEGRGYNWVNFEGQNPNHPSENMHEISSAELREINGRR